MTTDETGAATEETEYIPFGLMREHAGTEKSNYKYTDQELDKETNLYNYDARLYDPAMGIFTRPDDVTQNWYDPQTLNRYAYCRNNPLIYVDSTGHFINFGTALAGAAIGGTLGFAGSTIAQLIENNGDFSQVNFHNAGAAALGGVVSGGLAGATLGLSKSIRVRSTHLTK